MTCFRSQSDLDQDSFFILGTSSGESESIASPAKMLRPEEEGVRDRDPRMVG